MSDERVNVSKSLLDDLSDSVQALTGTAENMSIQEMSNAVSAKANESFELIETIVLTEEVNSVERTKEPDGTDYNFKEILVEVSFPTRYKMEADYNLGVTRMSFGSNFIPYFTGIAISKNSGVDPTNPFNSQLFSIRMHVTINKNLCVIYSSAGHIIR